MAMFGHQGKRHAQDMYSQVLMSFDRGVGKVADLGASDALSTRQFCSSYTITQGYLRIPRDTQGHPRMPQGYLFGRWSYHKSVGLDLVVFLNFGLYTLFFGVWNQHESTVSPWKLRFKLNQSDQSCRVFWLCPKLTGPMKREDTPASSMFKYCIFSKAQISGFQAV